MKVFEKSFSTSMLDKQEYVGAGHHLSDAVTYPQRKCAHYEKMGCCHGSKLGRPRGPIRIEIPTWIASIEYVLQC